MQSIKKISVATVHGKVKVDRDATKAIMIVLGVVTGTKSGTSQFGEWHGLTGQFKATDAETGEVFHANTCLLPDVALGQILASFKQNDGNPLEFAVEISAKGIPDRADDSITKHEYAAKWLLKEGADPFAALEKRVAGLLEAPKATASEDSPAPATKGKGK